MSATTPCPGCRAPVPVSPDVVGLIIECPRCGVQFEVTRAMLSPSPLEGEGRGEGTFRGAPVRHPTLIPSSRPSPPGLVPRSAEGGGEGKAEGAASEWDLPDASAPPPANIIAAAPPRIPVTRVALYLASLVVVFIVLAVMFAGLRPKMSVGSPPAEMWGMGRDVDAGIWRVRVTSVDWRDSPGGAAALEVRLTIENRSSVERPLPTICLGDRDLRDLSAQFSQPVPKTPSGDPLYRLKPAEPTDAVLSFSVPRGEFCLLIRPENAPPVPIALSIDRPVLK